MIDHEGKIGVRVSKGMSSQWGLRLVNQYAFGTLHDREVIIQYWKNANIFSSIK